MVCFSIIPKVKQNKLLAHSILHSNGRTFLPSDSHCSKDTSLWHKSTPEGNIIGLVLMVQKSSMSPARVTTNMDTINKLGG